MPEPRTTPPGVAGVGMPALLHLDRFGYWVFQSFGWVPYLVGSAATSKTWRDVDVRLILPDEEFEARFPGALATYIHDPAWTLTCAALSALAQQMTGLPVDFQIYPMTVANRYEGVRIPLGIVHLPPEETPDD
jgi:hypothetical protein